MNQQAVRPEEPSSCALAFECIRNEVETSSLTDITVRLGRAPRWAGATGSWWWTVLQHSLMMEEELNLKGADHETRLFALFHDMHEFATGDIPTQYKCADIIKCQAYTDTLLLNKFGLIRPSKEVSQRIAELDKECQYKENHHFREQDDFIPGYEHLTVTPIHTAFHNSTLVQEFVERFNQLLGMV